MALQQTDIVIVGAGPAGLSAALFLAKAKIPHMLIDRAIFPRDKVDGNVYGNKVLDILTALDPAWVGELLNRKEEVLPCHYTKIYAPNQKAARVTYGQRSEFPTKFFSMKRCHFDQFLVNKLDGTYTDFRQGTAVTGLTQTGAGWAIAVAQGETTATLNSKVILVADGANSKIAAMLGYGAPPSQYYDMVQGYCRGVKGCETDGNGENHTEGHFLQDVNPGFVFLAPIADGTVNVGIGIPRTTVEEKSFDVAAVFRDCIQSYPSLAERFRDVQWVQEPEPWPEKVGTWQRTKLVGDRHLLLGDAAGLCNPLTGFGTGNAMLSGQIAARHIERLVGTGDFSAASLHPYEQEIGDRLQTEFRGGIAIKNVLQIPALFNALTSPGWLRTLFRGLFSGRLQRLQEL